MGNELNTLVLMTSDYLDRKWLEEGKWVGGRWSLLLVEDSHLSQIKINCGVQGAVLSFLRLFQSFF